MPDTNAPSPKIFVSYSWSSPDHERWVLDLAERLTADGVHVALDKWELREGHDLYSFMERMVTDPEISKVLVVCDRVYAEKADGRLGGVGTETQIICQEVYEKVSQDKFIPVVTEHDPEGRAYLPTFLRSRIYIDLSNAQREHQEYERLIRSIFGKPLFKRPKLGTPPTYLLEDDLSLRQTIHKLRGVKNAIANNKPHARGLLADYFEALEEAFCGEKLAEPDGEVPFDEHVVGSIERFQPYRDEFVDLMLLIGRYTDDPELYREVHSCFERLLQIKYSSEMRGLPEHGTDNLSFILWELFLYAIAALIREKRFEHAAFLLGEPYFLSSTRYNSSRTTRTFETFDTYLRSIEDVRKHRLELRWITLAGHVLQQRAKHPQITFEQLVQADFLLGLRSLLHPHAMSGWYPRLLVYAENHDTFEVFVRGQARRYFDQLKLLLDVQDKEDLVRRIEQLTAANRFPEVERFWGGADRYKRLINLDDLATQ